MDFAGGGEATSGKPPLVSSARFSLFSSLLLSSLELSDTKVYEPCIRARLGTAAQFTIVARLSCSSFLMHVYVGLLS